MRRVFRVLLIVLTVFVIAMAYRVLGVYEFRAGECTAGPVGRIAPTYPRRLLVMSFNIEGHAALLNGGHIEAIAETINRHKPDIVGVNEVHRGTWQARFGDHAQELARLTGMNIAFGKSYRFAGGDFGNAVLTRGEIVSSDVHDLPGTGEPRTLLETVVRIDGGTIDFYVTHTAAWATFGRETRQIQLACVNKHVRGSRFPYVLTGDLNAPPSTPELSRFLKENVLRLAGAPDTPTHRLMEQRLDYILTDPGWRVESARVLDDGPSDHRPVIAQLVYP